MFVFGSWYLNSFRIKQLLKPNKEHRNDVSSRFKFEAVFLSVTSCLTFDTHLQRRLLDGDLAEDSSPVVGTNRLQLLLVERKQLSSGQDSEAGDGAARRKHPQSGQTHLHTPGQVISHLHLHINVCFWLQIKASNHLSEKVFKAELMRHSTEH